MIVARNSFKFRAPEGLIDFGNTTWLGSVHGPCGNVSTGVKEACVQANSILIDGLGRRWRNVRKSLSRRWGVLLIRRIQPERSVQRVCYQIVLYSVELCRGIALLLLGRAK